MTGADVGYAEGADPHGIPRDLRGRIGTLRRGRSVSRTANGAATFALRVNGVQQGAGWKASADDNAWKTPHGRRAYCLSQGDEIDVEVPRPSSASSAANSITCS